MSDLERDSMLRAALEESLVRKDSWTYKEIIQRGVFAALGHVKLDYRSPKKLFEAAGVIADFVVAALTNEQKP